MLFAPVYWGGFGTLGYFPRTLLVMDVWMSWPWSAVIGFAAGALAVGLVWALRHPWTSTPRIEREIVPDGLDTALAVIGATGLVLDRENRVIRASRTALDLGIVQDREIGIDEVRDLVDRARENGQPAQEEFELAGQDGEIVHVLVRVAPLGSRFVLLVAEDRSDVYRIDTVRRDFVANISHELKTPIGAVSLLAEALSFSADDPEQVRKFAESLEKEANRLAELTSDIIELSRLQSIGAVESGEPVQIDEAVSAAVDANRVYAESADIELVVKAKSGAWVMGDRGSLVTAVHNLIRNAVSYSTGPSRVGVGVVERDGRVEISVTDQGVGIPAAELGRVFERFYRGDPARSRQTGGTGLGLSIVKHVVHNHRGEVRVWSHPGRGSTFTIRLAVIEPDQLSSFAETPTVVSKGSGRTGKTRPAEFVASPPAESTESSDTVRERENA